MSGINQDSLPESEGGGNSNWHSKQRTSEMQGLQDSPVWQQAFSLLRQGRSYALQLGRSQWDFAVDLRSLRAVGLHLNDLRWLIYQGYVEHARELTQLDDTQRTFGPIGTSLFTKRACFVLTEAGAKYVDQIGIPTGTHAQGAGAVAGCSAGQNQSQQALKPRWDCDLREIRFAGQLVKQFKLPSPNQEAILMTFEEEGWKCRIDDPLPPHPQCDPKQRLHDTIRSLNRNQKAKLLRFKGDGTGEGILWEPILETNGTVEEE
jgi:hypothetical protein